MEKILKGLRVLVTRPEPQGEMLCQEIHAAGGAAIYFPTIKIVSLVNEAVFSQNLNQLGDAYLLIFISANAARLAAPKIKARWATRIESMKIAAVGKSTAVALAQEQLTVQICPTELWSSEGLLALPELQAIAGKKVVIVKGEGGREFLEEALLARGAEVMSLAAYRRELPEQPVEPVLQALRTGQIDVVVATSNEGLVNLMQLLGSAGWPYLQHAKLLLISERMVKLATSLGFTHIATVTKTAQNAAILAGLASIL